MSSLKEVAKQTLSVQGTKYEYYSLSAVADQLGIDLKKLPNSIKILFENLIRNIDGKTVCDEDIHSIKDWLKERSSDNEIAYRPARVLMQDFTGVPAVVDLAAMRDAVQTLGGDSKRINPLTRVDLVIDHSLQVDKYASADSFKKNVELEYERNKERYKFLKWGQQAFQNFRVVPPGTGICHQVNLEHLSKVVLINNDNVVYPDTLVGTDSHTTMVNGLSVLAWGVGGIEAEAAMLGQPISMVLPEVVGFELTGKLKEGITATDLVLTITQILRKEGVVGKFVEFFGEGLKYLSLADRATIANMAPEYGATCGFFPIDDETLSYLEITGKSAHEVELVRQYAKEQTLWNSQENAPNFTKQVYLDVSTVEPCLAGPKRPQDRILLKNVKESFAKEIANIGGNLSGKESELGHGDLVIAAITSCTNTSNPNVMLAAGLLAKKAVELGVVVKPWVKTSLAPGSKVVTEYLEKSGLQKYLDQIGFNVVGYGCTTCIGNSGPLLPEIEKSIKENDLLVGSVLSGNRNFEGRVHPLVKANYLASPPLVVAYAIAGSVKVDLSSEPIAQDKNGNDVFLKDLWPSNSEIRDVVSKCVTREMFEKKYADVFEGDQYWKEITVEASDRYNWDNSSYINNPPYFVGMQRQAGKLKDVIGAQSLVKLADSVTTDHISPAGTISANSPAARYLESLGINQKDFNSYGARRGNHEVMVRGTFANVRIRNELAPGTEGGFTTLFPENKVMSIYDAAIEYEKRETPLIVIAGKEYGTGSSRDWAAKGTKLLGVKAVIVESFERIHRSNLIGMGIVPLTFTNSQTRHDLNLKGGESFDIIGIENNLSPKAKISLLVNYTDGSKAEFELELAVYTANEISYLENGGILNYVLRTLV